ncbi:MAG: SNF2 helicase associated domain-containing protein [Deltaproteobacteria bacterium]|nr:SNF2 helicase associated domain-containing protein [Deltaproteobacteria bacterium]
MPQETPLDQEDGEAPSAPSPRNPLERWLYGRPGVGPKHHFGYRVTPQSGREGQQGGVMVEVLSRGMGPATTIDRFIGSHNRIDVADRRVFDVLKLGALGPRQIYIVSPNHAGRLLKMMQGLNVVDGRTQKPLQWKGAVTAQIEDAREGERVRLSVRWKNAAGDALNIQQHPWAVFDEYPPVLWVAGQVFFGPERLVGETLRRLLQEPSIDFDVSVLGQSVSRLEHVLSELGIDPAWLSERLAAPTEDKPKMKLVLSFAGGALAAEATVHVGPHAFTLQDGVDVPEAVWLPAAAPKWATRVRRDREAERSAIQILRDAVFVHEQNGRWRITGDDALDLVRRELAPLVGHFELFWVKAPEPRAFRPDPLKSKLTVRETGRGDWFEVAVDFATGDAKVPIAEVIAQVEKGTRFIQLSDGTYAEATPALRQAVRVMQMLLGDRTGGGSTAVAGKALLSSKDVGDLEGLMEVVDGFDLSELSDKHFAPLKDFKRIDPVDVPKNFQATLRDYQKDGLAWMVFLNERKIGGILADDMGLGKTVQTLAALHHLSLVQGRKPSLVVCPTSVVENWVRETHRFVPDFIVHRIDGPHRDEYLAKAKDADLLVTSYALLRRDFDKLKVLDLRYAILDEAQAIKNPQSQTAQCAKALKAEHRLALTGTPIENRLSELWSIFDFVSPELLGTLTDFKERFLSPIERYSDQPTLERLRRRIRPFVLRREKEVVAKELPPKTISQVFCDVPKATQGLYRQIADVAKDHLAAVMKQKGFERSTVSILTELLRLRQIACDPRLLKNTEIPKGALSPKLEPFLELVEEALDSGRKILVFSQFVGMLELISEGLTEKKTEHLMLTGQTRRRQVLIDKFQADDGPRVFLISLKAGGSGLNLTAADTVIHFDPWWNPAVEEQATDRAHRIGQTKPVFVYELVARNTVEEKILKLKERKRQLAEGVLGVDAALNKLLSEDEVMALFDVDEWQDE